MANFRFDTDADGIVLLTWDMPGRSMNVITPEVMKELSEAIETIAADPAIKGAMITSGKDSFSGGADLAMLQGMGATFAAHRQSRRRTGGAEGVPGGIARVVADLSPLGDLRKAVRRRHQRGVPGRRVRTDARLPLSRARRHRQSARRPAWKGEEVVGLFPRCRRDTQRVARR